MNVSSLGRRLSVLLLAGAALSGTAQAATQGNLGATSTGSVTINANVPSQVRISGLEDVNFLNADPNVDAQNAQNVCVWSNTSTRGYRVTASGSGTSSALTITNGTNAIPYSVQWDDVASVTTGTGLATGVALTGQTSAATKSNCSGSGETASLIVRIASADLQDMTAGPANSYTGLLTLTVAPE